MDSDYSPPFHAVIAEISEYREVEVESIETRLGYQTRDRSTYNHSFPHFIIGVFAFEEYVFRAQCYHHLSICR